MKANTSEFRDKFEKALSSDFVMLDNTSNIVWRDGDPGYFLVVVTPKTEDVFEQIRDHAVKVIRDIGTELFFKAEGQKLVVNGSPSIVFKITPEKS